MTQKSYYWDGTVTGDASLAPYQPVQYHDNWKILFTETDDDGYIDNYLNELLPTLGDQQVSVASGAALVNGWYYENTDVVQFDIDTPVSNPRIDRIVVRLSTLGQTARLTKIVGTEAASPTAPALTQANTTWDIPIIQVLITTGSVMSGVDERIRAKSPLLPQGGIVKIDEIVSDGSLIRFIFEDIPQIYNHLFLETYLRSAETTGTLRLQINDGDIVSDFQQLEGDNAAISAATSIGVDFGYNAGGIPNSTSTANYYGQVEFYLSNYRSAFYKQIISNNFSPRTNVLGNLEYLTRGGIIPDTNPITQIILFQSDSLDRFANGSMASLYGMI
jgi:hypothetical protein